MFKFKTAGNRCQWSPRQPGRGELSPFHLVPAPSHAPHESWKKYFSNVFFSFFWQNYKLLNIGTYSDQLAK